jgi:hypothetical protein
MLASQAGTVVVADMLAAAGQGRLAEALATAGAENTEAIAAHYDEQLGQLSEYEKIHALVAAGGTPEQLDPQARAFLRDRFMEKLVPVRDYYTPGEEIVRLVARNTPPGLVNRILGMQNIKGTGLDWVYRWQAWETVHRACVQARDADSGVAARGIATLSTYQEYGALSEAVVRETIEALKTGSAAPDAFLANQLDGIIERLEAQIAVFNKDGSAGEDTDDSKAKQSGGFGAALAGFLEQFLDSTDAVRRRLAADRIYDALIAEQISSQRAALELKKLTSRQKGGWLSAGMSAATGKITSYIPRRSGNVKAH